jgi:phosphoribosylformimino-5-aminoimidazole carboxamide ribotide isomerase
MKIIPAIDILNGQIVRLTEGDYNQKTTYSNHSNEASPLLGMVKEYQSMGFDQIHVIDLNGAKGDSSNEAYIANAVQGGELQIQVGGGIRTIDKIMKLLDAGVYRVILGTVAITNPEFLTTAIKTIPAEKMIVAIDVLDEVIKYNGWLESSPVLLNDFIGKCLELGYQRFLCTDISKDGKLQGPGLQLYIKLKKEFPEMKLIASGGVSAMADIYALAKTGAESVVVGKAIFENKISLEEIAVWNSTLNQ